MKLPAHDGLRYLGTFHVSGSRVHVGVLLCRLRMDWHNSLLIMLFPKVSEVIIIISAITVKIKIRIFIVLQQFREYC